MSLRPPSSGAAEAAEGGRSRATLRGFVAILAVALALRVAMALGTNAVHPDEIFQYLEQAHRHAFGYGVVPWEYRYGMRNWLLPLALSGPMRLGDWIAPGTGLYLLLPRLMMALLGLAVVAAAFRIGDRLSRAHAWVAMAVAAIWWELAYFGGHTLTEAAAVAAALPGAALLGDPKAGRRSAAVGGLLLGFAVLLRFHYAPAIGVFVLMTCGTDWRGRWAPAVAGGLVALAVGAAVDLAMGQVPFSWIVANFQQNILANRAAGFGVSPPLTYVRALGAGWGLFFAPILLAIVPVFNRYRPLVAMAAVNFLVHSAIGHKEYRFILLSAAILVLLAAIGSAEYVLRLRERMPPRRARLALPALVLLWAGASGSLMARGRLTSEWQAFEGGSQAMAALRGDASLCGVGMVGVNFWDSGGYTYLHRNVPIYVGQSDRLPGPQPRLETLAPAFNAIVAAAEKRSMVPAGYREIGCSGPEHGAEPREVSRVCTFVREGGCEAGAGGDRLLDRIMRRQDW